MFALLGSVLCAAQGCGRDDPGSRYFPLAVGRTWLYEVERTTMDGAAELRHVISSVAPPPGSAIDAVRLSAAGQRYLYAVDDGGVFRVGEQVGGRPATVDPNKRSLVLPREIGGGTTWQSTTRTTVLENTGPPWETLFRIDVPLTMSYSVDALATTVETPAGRFDDCLLVTGHGRTNADVGNYIGHTEIEVTSREWFAPGVGLVRLERTETTTASALNAGRLVMQLAGWHAD